jgi:hypothetical protein
VLAIVILNNAHISSEKLAYVQIKTTLYGPSGLFHQSFLLNLQPVVTLGQEAAVLIQSFDGIGFLGSAS